METYEVLEKALALIEDERNWTQGDYRIGDALCAEGACIVAGGGALEWDGARYVMGDGVPDDYARAHIALNDLVTNSVHGFNDSGTHAEVVALFQQAIRTEKAKAGVSVDVPAPVAQQEEHAPCKGEGPGSIPGGGSCVGGASA